MRPEGLQLRSNAYLPRRSGRTYSGVWALTRKSAGYQRQSRIRLPKVKWLLHSELKFPNRQGRNWSAEIRAAPRKLAYCFHWPDVGLFNQDFHFAILADGLYLQPPPSELFFSFLPSRATPAAQEEGPPSGSSGAEKPGSASFQAISHDTSPPPPSFARFASPAAAPIRSAPAAPQSAAPCSRTAAASDGSRPAAASSTGRA